MVECKDCGLDANEGCWDLKDPLNVHMQDHKDLCCDCFDENQGMPAEKRTYPRPKKD